jgi:serine/threonine-protein kinase
VAGFGVLALGVIAALGVAHLLDRVPVAEGAPPAASSQGTAPPQPGVTAPPVSESPGGVASAPAEPARSPDRDPSGQPRPIAARKAPAPVSFTVHVRPYAQRALLDGAEVATDEQRVVFSIGPGVHRLRIEHPCCEPFDREIDAASAERIGELKVPLVPRAASLRIGGDPATRVYVGGKFLGTAADSQRDPFRVRVPPDGPNPYEGEVDLLLEAPGRRASGATVRVRAGQEITVPAVLTEETSR